MGILERIQRCLASGEKKKDAITRRTSFTRRTAWCPTREQAAAAMADSRHSPWTLSLGCCGHWEPLQIRVACAWLCPSDRHEVLLPVTGV